MSNKERVIEIMKAELFPMQLCNDSDPIEIFGHVKAAEKIDALYQPEEGQTVAIQKQDEQYHLACQNCGTTSQPLQMIPFRNDENVVGLLTCCDECKDDLYGQRFDREAKFTLLKMLAEEEIKHILYQKFLQALPDSEFKVIHAESYADEAAEAIKLLR